MDRAENEAENIYACMLAGDEHVKKIKNKSIFLVGETRVGKSTLLNYLRGLRLQVTKDEDGRKNVYVCNDEDSAYAKGGFTSVTLLPNIVDSIFMDGVSCDISLQDMAGYKDSGRNYVGVFGVSYMLKMALKAAR